MGVVKGATLFSDPQIGQNWYLTLLTKWMSAHKNCVMWFCRYSISTTWPRKFFFWNVKNFRLFLKNRWFWGQLWTVIDNDAAVENFSFLVCSLLKDVTFVWKNKIFAHSARWPEISCPNQPITISVLLIKSCPNGKSKTTFISPTFRVGGMNVVLFFRFSNFFTS